METDPSPSIKTGGLFSILSTIIMGVLIVALMVTAFMLRDRAADAEDRLGKMYFRAQSLEGDAARYRDIVRFFGDQPLQIMPTLSDSDIAAFKRKGVDDPYADIPEALLRTHELTPLDSLLDSRMVMFDRDRICVLGPDRLLAHYTDVDTTGRAIFRFDVSPSGTFTWEVIYSVVEE